MKTRFQMLRQKKKNIDPLVISHFDWDNEWTDSLHVPPQGHRGCELDDGLTWNLVDEVVGASEALRGRNLPRTAHRNNHGEPITYRKRARSSATIVEDDEDEHMGSENEEEEELQDPYDDVDVTDDEDSPSNDAEENRDAANSNEFDDGY